MKNLDDIFELLDGIIPSDAKKNIIFCEVESKAYEIFYYSYYADEICKQCYELVDEDRLDVTVLERGFEKVAEFIRNCDKFDSEKRNVVTILIEGTIETAKFDQFDKSIGIYQIKKEWKTKYL